MTIDERGAIRVKVQVSDPVRDRERKDRRVARVTVTVPGGNSIPFQTIKEHVKLEERMEFVTKHGLMLISGTEDQTGRFLPLILAAVEAAGYEIVKGT